MSQSIFQFFHMPVNAILIAASLMLVCFILQ